MVWLVAALALQGSVDVPVAGGQREIVLGMLESPATEMQIIFQRDLPAIFGPNNFVPPERIRARLGYIRWEVRIGLLGGRNVRVLRSEAFVEQSSPDSDAAGQRVEDTWWVDPDGKIVRHFHKTVGRDGVAEADCAYRADRIDVTQRRPGKPDERKTFVPTEPMQRFHDRFLPMFEDGKLVRKEKDFLVFDPLAMKVQKMALKHGGRYARPEGRALGEYFDLTGDAPAQRIYVTPSGFVQQIDLPRGRVAVPRD